MADIQTLLLLNGTVTILGHGYWVDWNAETMRAEVRRDGKVIADFPFELDAHDYIMGLHSLHQKDNDWRKI